VQRSFREPVGNSEEKMDKLRIKRIDVLSLAKIYAVMGAVIGLIIGIIYGLFTIVFGAMMMGLGQKEGLAAGGGSIVIGLVMIVAFPIIYAIGGFIGGAIGALIYNLFAKMVGGIEIEVESVR
jgi:hypothetical protein